MRNLIVALAAVGLGLLLLRFVGAAGVWVAVAGVAMAGVGWALGQRERVAERAARCASEAEEAASRATPSGTKSRELARDAHALSVAQRERQERRTARAHA